jgi:hypothetical protein
MSHCFIVSSRRQIAEVRMANAGSLDETLSPHAIALPERRGLCSRPPVWTCIINKVFPFGR